MPSDWSEEVTIAKDFATSTFYFYRKSVASPNKYFETVIETLSN